MPELEKEVIKETKENLKNLMEPVRLIYFTQEHACDACADQGRLLEQLVRLSDKLVLEVKELVEDSADAKRYGVDKVPATVVLSEKDHGIRFYGLTAGYEFASLLEAILMVSTGETGLDPAVEAIARGISVPVHLEVMVTLTCPYCPRMVRLAHQLAFVNDNIRSDMIDSSEFPELVQRYHVQGVPRTVINECPAFEGALPPISAIMEILKEIDPVEYERVDAELREARGERRAEEAKPEGEYDVIIVGAGPAAMSAAVYVVRKDWRVAMLGEKAGGQINDTATIENYLGMRRVDGRELAELFRDHVEAYPVAVRLHTAVTKVAKRDNMFEVITKDGHTYRGRSVIYAAGKQYRQLGVPGESRFLGHGVAFCATCDAPLFRDKRVAVVGGGNSAFTAVRDLQKFAGEIHLIHILDEFQADPVLVQEARKAPNVTFHMATEVRQFLGEENLAGIRVASTDGKKRYDLKVDGAFLEIGLVANTAPVKELAKLNEAGEIIVGRDQSTEIPGFFAAGDVTDEREKQIVVAVGDGARAALTVDRYLAELKSIRISDTEAPARSKMAAL